MTFKTFVVVNAEGDVVAVGLSELSAWRAAIRRTGNSDTTRELKGHGYTCKIGVTTV